MYTLSIVMLIPDQHRSTINALGEASGYGPDNLSRPLVDADGNQWWGGHTMAAPSFLEEMSGVTDYPEAMAALIMSVHDTDLGESSGLSHWQEALAANNLTQPIIEATP